MTRTGKFRLINLLGVTACILLPGVLPAQGFAVTAQSLVPEQLASLEDEIEVYRERNHPATSVAFWAESSSFGSVFAQENEPRPAASTIKIFILIAACMEFHDHWTEVPAELPDILNHSQGFQDPLSMFDITTRNEIRDALAGMSFEELSRSMMGINQDGIGNSAYNAAANTLIYLLGGPEACTEKIRLMHPDFGSVRVGRYMLVERTPQTDNVSSMRSLAAACRMICAHTIPGLSEAEHQEIADCFQTLSFHGLTAYQKHGHLSDEPAVNAWIGWFESDGVFFIYGVNVLLPDGRTVDDEGADHYCELIRDRLSALQTDV